MMMTAMMTIIMIVMMTITMILVLLLLLMMIITVLMIIMMMIMMTLTTTMLLSFPRDLKIDFDDVEGALFDYLKEKDGNLVLGKFLDVSSFFSPPVMSHNYRLMDGTSEVIHLQNTVAICPTDPLKYMY